MRTLRPMLMIVGAALVGSWAAAALAAQESKTDREAIRVLQRQLHSPTPSVRVQGVEGLREFPTAEVAKLVVPHALTDPAEEVRRAAYQTLLAWKDKRAVDAFLLRMLNSELRGKKGNVLVAAPLLAVLLASDLAEPKHELSKLLNGYAAMGTEGVTLITTVADALGKQGDQQSLTVLQRMSKLTCFSQTFACRRAVIQAMISIRLPEAVDALIELLPKVDGEARGDVLRHLGNVSGEQYGAHPEAWQAWWKKHKEKFQFPAEGAMSQATAAPHRDLPSYYGLPIQARRIVFVVDISGSMHGPRLAASERELNKTIDSLPEDASFSIVAFNNQVMVWKKNLVPATLASKQSAQQYVYNLRPAAGRMPTTRWIWRFVSTPRQSTFSRMDAKLRHHPRAHRHCRRRYPRQPRAANIAELPRHPGRRGRRPVGSVHADSGETELRRVSPGRPVKE